MSTLRHITLFTEDRGISLQFTLQGLKSGLSVSLVSNINLSSVSYAYRKGLVAYDTELIDLYLKSFGAKATLSLFRSKNQTLLLDLNDLGAMLPLPTGFLINVLECVRAWIKREPNLEWLDARGIPIHNLVPTICGFEAVPLLPLNRQLNLYPFFMGVISSRKRLIWSLHLKKHLREKFDLTLLLPEIDIYPGLAYDRLRPGISEPFVIPFANNYTPPASYAKRFLTRLPVLCLPGLGPVTERHLQALSSGRLAIMDDSISKLKIPMLELKSGSNCLIASTRNEMVQFAKDVMDDPSTALKIAKTGMEMFKDCYSPERWFLNNRDLLSGV